MPPLLDRGRELLCIVASNITEILLLLRYLKWWKFGFI